VPAALIGKDRIEIRLDDCEYFGEKFCADCYYDLRIKQHDINSAQYYGPGDSYMLQSYNLDVTQRDCGSTYYIYAKCGNGCGYSDAQALEVVYECGDLYCDPPVELLSTPTVESESAQAITVTWNQGRSCSTNGGCRYNVSYRNGGALEVVETTLPSFTLLDPTEGQSVFCVSLVNECGVGPYSPCLYTEVSLCEKPEAPTVLVSEVQCAIKIEWFDNIVFDQANGLTSADRIQDRLAGCPIESYKVEIKDVLGRF
jgi:hypothetical protein